MRTGREGRLWQRRFYSEPLDEMHLEKCIPYVHKNPVRAELVAKAEDYQWSNAGHRGHSRVSLR